MNANRLIGMALNMILRRVMRAGINKGMDAVSKRGKTRDGNPPQPGPDTRDAQKRMRHSIRLGRRLGRF